MRTGYISLDTGGMEVKLRTYHFHIEAPRRASDRSFLRDLLNFVSTAALTIGFTALGMPPPLAIAAGSGITSAVDVGMEHGAAAGRY